MSVAFPEGFQELARSGKDLGGSKKELNDPGAGLPTGSKSTYEEEVRTWQPPPFTRYLDILLSI